MSRIDFLFDFLIPPPPLRIVKVFGQRFWGLLGPFFLSPAVARGTQEIKYPQGTKHMNSRENASFLVKYIFFQVRALEEKPEKPKNCILGHFFLKSIFFCRENHICSETFLLVALVASSLFSIFNSVYFGQRVIRSTRKHTNHRFWPIFPLSEP